MANSQINQLQAHYNGLSVSQKGEFIEKLKVKLQNSTNLEYADFLNACIADYEYEVNPPKIDNIDFGDLIAAGVPAPIVSTPKKKNKVMFLAISVFVIAVITVGFVLAFSMLNENTSNASNASNVSSEERLRMQRDIQNLLRDAHIRTRAGLSVHNYHNGLHVTIGYSSPFDHSMAGFFFEDSHNRIAGIVQNYLDTEGYSLARITVHLYADFATPPTDWQPNWRSDFRRIQTWTTNQRVAYTPAPANPPSLDIDNAGGYVGSTTEISVDVLLEIENDFKNIMAGIGFDIQIFDVMADREANALIITLPASDIFPSASRELLPTAKNILDALAIPLLGFQENNHNIVVEVHTDNVPINTAQFTNNLQLSIARSSEIVIYLLDEWELLPTLISSRGMGDERSIDTNETVEGRARNRRIEIRIYV